MAAMPVKRWWACAAAGPQIDVVTHSATQAKDSVDPRPSWRWPALTTDATERMNTQSCTKCFEQSRQQSASRLALTCHCAALTEPACAAPAAARSWPPQGHLEFIATTQPLAASIIAGLQCAWGG